MRSINSTVGTVFYCRTLHYGTILLYSLVNIIVSYNGVQGKYSTLNQTITSVGYRQKKTTHRLLTKVGDIPFMGCHTDDDRESIIINRKIPIILSNMTV